LKKIKVYVAIPSLGTVADLLLFALREWEHDYGDKIEFVFPKTCTYRKFHDFARNAIVEEFLETDCDILWFIDSDVVPCRRAPELSTKHGDLWELAGCPYPVFMKPKGYKRPQVVFCVYKRAENGKLHAARVPQEGREFVDGLATGCIFIKREVLEKLSPPYFEFKFNPETRAMEYGEDLGFCLKTSDLGYQFFVDYELICKHYKTVDLLEVNNYAIEYAKEAVNNYDNMIKPAVAKLAEKYTALKAQSQGRTKSGLILPD